MTTRELYRNPDAKGWRTDAPEGVIDFHRTLPGYASTRLVELPSLARELGVGRLFVKEEASRFGLPAFKILGASYAVSRALSARLGGGGRVLGLPELRERLQGAPALTLHAATDGNHGRAVARMAKLLGLSAHIFIPAGLTDAAKGGIASEGAELTELEGSYDDVVEAAADAAAAKGDQALLIQDTSWEGYEEVPRWIVDGYSTLFDEADEQLRAAGVTKLDAVAVPTGVGSLLEAGVRHYRAAGMNALVVSVEPEHAPAMFASLRAGQPLTVPTQATVMHGLNCGTPSPAAWQVVKRGLDAALTVTDDECIRAVRDLEQLGVDAGPCGAASLAGTRKLVADKPLGDEATLLLISTESRAANPLP